MSKLSNEVARRKEEQARREIAEARQNEVTRRHRVNGGLIGGLVAIAGAIAIATPLVLSAMASDNDAAEVPEPVATVIQDDLAETVVDEYPAEDIDEIAEGSSTGGAGEATEGTGEATEATEGTGEVTEVAEEAAEYVVGDIVAARDILLDRTGISRPYNATSNEDGEPALVAMANRPVALKSWAARLTGKDDSQKVAYAVVTLSEYHDGSGTYHDYYTMFIDASTGETMGWPIIFATRQSDGGGYAYDWQRSINLLAQYILRNSPGMETQEEAQALAEETVEEPDFGDEVGGLASLDMMEEDETSESSDDGPAQAAPYSEELTAQGISNPYIAMKLGFIEYSENAISEAQQASVATGFVFDGFVALETSPDGKASFTYNEETWGTTLGIEGTYAREYMFKKRISLVPGTHPIKVTSARTNVPETSNLLFAIASDNPSVAYPMETQVQDITSASRFVDLYVEGYGEATLTISAYVNEGGRMTCIDTQKLDIVCEGPTSVSTSSIVRQGFPTSGQSATLSPQTIIAFGKSVAMGKTVSIGAETSGNGVLTYKSSAPDVAKVSATGIVTPVKAGNATITITASKTNNYLAATKTINVKVTQGTQTISASNKSVAMGKTVRIGATAKTAVTYASGNTNVAKVNKTTGIVTPVKPGTAKITITAAKTNNWKATTKTIVVTVTKGTMTAKYKKMTVTASLKTLKSKAVTLSSNITVAKGQGKVTYANASSDTTAKKFKVNSTTGQVTVPKGTKKGTYTIKVKATAAGNGNYKAGSITVAYKIQVK